jgi:hypothetical protein
MKTNAPKKKLFRFNLVRQKKRNIYSAGYHPGPSGIPSPELGAGPGEFASGFPTGASGCPTRSGPCSS